MSNTQLIMIPLDGKLFQINILIKSNTNTVKY